MEVPLKGEINTKGLMHMTVLEFSALMTLVLTALGVGYKIGKNAK